MLKSKSRNLLLLLSLCMSQNSFAELSLHELMEKFSHTTFVNASFTETKQLALLDSPLILEGTLSYHAPDYLKKVVNKPAHSLFEINGESLRIETDKEQRTLPLDSHPLIRVFAESYRAMLSGNSMTLEQYFETELTGTMDNWTLKLLPRNDYVRTRIKTIQMTGSGARIQSSKTVEVSGDMTLMTIITDDD